MKRRSLRLQASRTRASALRRTSGGVRGVRIHASRTWSPPSGGPGLTRQAARVNGHEVARADPPVRHRGVCGHAACGRHHFLRLPPRCSTTIDAPTVRLKPDTTYESIALRRDARRAAAGRSGGNRSACTSRQGADDASVTRGGGGEFHALSRVLSRSDPSIVSEELEQALGKTCAHTDGKVSFDLWVDHAEA